MLYAKVVLGIPIDGPFDYVVPEHLAKRTSIGSRVWVSFGSRRMLGYVVGLIHRTKIQKPKKILEAIDEYPVLNKNMLLLTWELSSYYCCSWGEAIEASIPQDLREGKNARLNLASLEYTAGRTGGYQETILFNDLDGKARWDFYLAKIRDALGRNTSVIVLLPDFNSVLKAKEIIKSILGIEPGILNRKQAKEYDEWLKIKEGKVNIALGTRSGIFAPFNNLGLIIIDEEQESVYKQDQVPHYNAREVAFMRIVLEKAKLILGSTSPSLESLYLVKKNKIHYTFIPSAFDFPEIKIIDMKRSSSRYRKNEGSLSKFLEDSINSVLALKGKVLLFLNRKGFATSVTCPSCKAAMKCPRCNINLVYHFQHNLLNCRYCNYKIEASNICPNCNAGYLKYAGIGTEKIESELSRIFADAKIKRIDKQGYLDIEEADVFVSTSFIIKQTGFNFDIIGVLGADNSLNRIDFRSAEKTFALLLSLSKLTDKKLVIQTRLPMHKCFEALVKKDINIFYEEELRQRKQLNFPPYKHIILIKLRGKKEEKVKQASFALFNKLSQANKNRTVKIISVHPGQPAKLRGSFYWQLLVSSSNPKIANKFLKICLKDFPHSGIIVTVDVDPI